MSGTCGPWSSWSEATESRARSSSSRRSTADDPGLVRAQSELVLLYDDIEDVHRELEQLRSIAPDHLVVRLAGPQIDAEWEASRSMRTQTP